MGREILGQKRRISFFRLLPLPELILIAFLFFFSIATGGGGRRRGRHDDGRVRAAI
jgi:membrane associated rhomboid family serine protease